MPVKMYMLSKMNIFYLYFKVQITLTPFLNLWLIYVYVFVYMSQAVI